MEVMGFRSSQRLSDQEKQRKKLKKLGRAHTQQYLKVWNFSIFFPDYLCHFQSTKQTIQIITEPKR